MRVFAALVFLMINSSVFASNADIIALRALYFKASESNEYCSQFYQRLANISEKSEPILLCYKGMALLLRSKHRINPYAKFSDFNSGKKLLEQAVNRSADNIEIRFMRFCVQSQAPAILGYNGNLNEDKIYILKSWKAISDNDLKGKIKTYMLKYANCSVNEKIYLE